MSEQTIELVRGALDEFNSGELGPRFDSLFGPRVEFRDEFVTLDGFAALRAYIAEFSAALGGVRLVWEDVREAGDSLVLVMTQEGRGAVSGAAVEQRFTWVLTFDGQRCTRWHIYADHAEALAAAGVDVLR